MRYAVAQKGIICAKTNKRKPKEKCNLVNYIQWSFRKKIILCETNEIELLQLKFEIYLAKSVYQEFATRLATH